MQFLNQDYLKNDLIEVKDLFKASYQNQVIMHMLIINYDGDTEIKISQMTLTLMKTIYIS